MAIKQGSLTWEQLNFNLFIINLMLIVRGLAKLNQALHQYCQVLLFFKLQAHHYLKFHFQNHYFLFQFILHFHFLCHYLLLVKLHYIKYQINLVLHLLRVLFLSFFLFIFFLSREYLLGFQLLIPQLHYCYYQYFMCYCLHQFRVIISVFCFAFS